MANSENNKIAILVDFNTVKVDGKVKCVPSVMLNGKEQLENPPLFNLARDAKGFAQIEAFKIEEQCRSQFIESSF